MWRFLRGISLSWWIVIATVLGAFVGYLDHDVWLDTNVWREFGCLQRDEVRAGYLAANSLIEAGHRRIVYFVRPEASARAALLSR